MNRKSGKPIVWVIKEQVRRGMTGPEPMDYTLAMRYGDIRFITEYDLPSGPSNTLQARWNDAVAAFVRDYDEDRDFIIATGQPHAMVLIGWALGVAQRLPRFLVWRREEGHYVPFTPGARIASAYAA